MDPTDNNFASYVYNAVASGGNDGDERTVAAAPMGACNAAMNLFEKYSSLNRGIDETRKEMKRARAEIDNIQEKIQQTQQDRATMKRDTAKANQETNEYHQLVDQANQALIELEAQRSRELMKKQRAERELQLLKDYRETQYQDFKDRSREFRADMKRKRFCAADVGLKYAHLKAFVTVMADPSVEQLYPAMEVPVSAKDFDEGYNVNYLQPAKEMGGEAPCVDDGIQTNLTSDPTLWIPDPRDEEMKQALEMYRNKMAEYQQQEKEVAELRAKYEEASEIARKRDQRKQQLQTQHDRIKKENDEMQNNLETLKQETKETEALGKSFEKQVKCKRLALAQQRFESGGLAYHPTQAAPAVPFRAPVAGNRPAGVTVTENPYAKKRKTNDGGASHRQGTNGTRSSRKPKHQGSTGGATNAGFRQPRSIRRQSPPHAGSGRVDRPFTSNLVITAHDSEPSQDNHQRGQSPISTKNNHLSFLDDDSDSDDELLSFAPFAKRS